MRADLSHTLSLLLIAAHIVVILRILLRPQREPASRLAWLIAVVAAPLVGLVAYLLIGEARISAKRRQRYVRIEQRLPRPEPDEPLRAKLAASAYAAPFALAETVNGLSPTSGNSARLAADGDAAIREMVADIDAAQHTVHLCFYIWLADTNGRLVKDALISAAKRGVTVRVLADALGSRGFIRSQHWADLGFGGVDARIALPIGGPLWTLIRGRFDLRNHRKQLIVDGRIVWCGSQNLADPAFRIKPRFAPWVDIMVRCEGPVARDCQLIFAADWACEHGEDLFEVIGEAVTATTGKIAAQVIATGPTQSYPAMSSCFCALIHAARRELVITTPYFVPDEQLILALLDAGRRGVATTLILPRRNDSRVVAGASRSYYADLIAAGIQLHEFVPGLLHAKTMVVDREVTLVGSANLDRRSFELNFENNVLFADPGFAAQVRARQDEYLAQSTPFTATTLARFGILDRLWQNAVAMVSPLL